MTAPLPIRCCTLHRIAIPMRQKVEHAAAQRVCSEPIIFSIELANGVLGFGETHAREYVSGESLEDVIRSIRDVFIPMLVEVRPANFGEAIEFAAALPTRDADGRVMTAARAAVEIALLDAYSRAFRRSLESIAGYLEETDFGRPGSRDTCRYSVVIPARTPQRAARLARYCRWAGIRNFKVKVGDAADDARLRALCHMLRRPLASGAVTLYIDANMAWDATTAREKLTQWHDLPILCVEQPLPKSDLINLAHLAREAPFQLMADESVVTYEDAEAVIQARAAEWFNLRISKHGGLIPTLRLAILARRHQIRYQLGCMVGETSILSAAGRWFLQMAPAVARAEGSFGGFLLSDDVVARSMRFGIGGRWQPVKGPGLGLDIDPDHVRRLNVTDPTVIQL